MAEGTSAPNLISRQEAKRLGLKHYFTGKPCKRGHVTLRYVKSIACAECLKINLRAVRARLPDLYKRFDREQKDRDREKLRQRDRTRYWTNPDVARARVRAYYQANTEIVKQKARDATRERRLRNDESYETYSTKATARAKRWANANPDKVLVYKRNQRARRKSAPGSHTADDVHDIHRMQKGRCAFCRNRLKKYDVDHIVPLSKGGSNGRANLQLLCAPCNRRKWAHDQIEVMRSLGRLL